MSSDNSNNSGDRVVSSDSEQLILVNSDDAEAGFLDKGQCHDGEGILHRAFSLFIFNSRGELLLQKRASASACGHCIGPTVAAAIRARESP